MLLLTLKNFDNVYVNKELERLIQVADVEEKPEEMKVTQEEIAKDENLEAANYLGHLVFSEGFRRRIPTTAVAIDKKERLQIKVEHAPNVDRELEKNPGEHDQEYIIQDVNVMEHYKAETETIFVKHKARWRPYNDDFNNYDEESTQITTKFMKNFKYDHNNWKHIIFKDTSDNKEDNNTLGADDFMELESVGDEIKKEKLVFPGTINSSVHGVQDDDKYRAKTYDFNRYRKKEYKELLKKIDQREQKEKHSFLSTLRKVKDKKPNYQQLPQTYTILEKISNVSGKFMSSQLQLDPAPFVEIGDLAHRLVYMDRSMLSATETEIVTVKPMGKEVGPVESVEFSRILLGLQVTIEIFKENKVEQAILGKFMTSVKLFDHRQEATAGLILFRAVSGTKLTSPRIKSLQIGCLRRRQRRREISRRSISMTRR